MKIRNPVSENIKTELELEYPAPQKRIYDTDMLTQRKYVHLCIKYSVGAAFT